MTERACDLSHTLQQVLVLNTNDLVASQRLDLLNGIAPPHHIDRAQTQVPGQLNDEPADGGARRGLQQPCSRLDVELTSRQEQRGQRVDRELTGIQAQDIVRLADLSGYERAHGLRHEWPFVSQHPTKSANVLGRNDATSGESRRHVCSLT
ncbi:hypothetical protein [Streptomyces collinus]|uniref:hypothetical protein n=1 Tax=Streptomyces collinus TaxID=42684 RepID=UPI0036B774D3